MRKLTALILLALLVTLMAAGQRRKLTPHVWTVDVGTCALDYHTLPAQARTLVLACAGRDMLRLWPFPPVHPWFEDGGKSPPVYPQA